MNRRRFFGLLLVGAAASALAKTLPLQEPASFSPEECRRHAGPFGYDHLEWFDSQNIGLYSYPFPNGCTMARDLIPVDPSWKFWTFDRPFVVAEPEP